MKSNKSKLADLRKKFQEKRQKKNTPLKQTPVSECDFLLEDPVIDNQLFTCLSFVTPTEKMMTEAYSHISDGCGITAERVSLVVKEWEAIMAPRRAMKVRGSFRTMENASKRCDAIKEFDAHHNVFVAEVGKWVTFAPDAETVEEQVYADTELNSLMKGKREEDIRVKKHYEERKKSMMDDLLNARAVEPTEPVLSDPRALDAQVQATKNSILQLEDRLLEMRAKLDAEEAEFAACCETVEYIPDADLAVPDNNPMISEIDK